MAAVATLERTTFRTSRLLEFCSRKELVAQTGHEPEAWPLVVLKELLDNALDACEEAGVAPEIMVQVEPRAITVVDNGPGMPPETVTDTQQLLPDFMTDHPGATAEWDVVFDARGHFHEPHTGRTVPLGTIEVRGHLREVAEHTLPELQVQLPEMAIFPTCGPEHRYGAILFVEKEGFLPLFRAVHLAERYDLTIMSTKGLSVTASRMLVDRLCSTYDVPLLVLHDFDKSGFSILGTLRRDTRRYAFRNRIEVVDLGLRLEDVEDSEHETEDVVQRSDPAPNLRENGATAEEIAFLRTRRVELNAFASTDFVAWIVRKLEQHGVAKVVPHQDTLMLAYRRSVASHYVTSRLQSTIQEAQGHAAEAPVPDDLTALVAAGLRGDRARSWDDVVQQLAMQRVGPDEG
jgi:hypothetical protein